MHCGCIVQCKNTILLHTVSWMRIMKMRSLTHHLEYTSLIRAKWSLLKRLKVAKFFLDSQVFLCFFLHAVLYPRTFSAEWQVSPNANDQKGLWWKPLFRHKTKSRILLHNLWTVSCSRNMQYLKKKLHITISFQPTLQIFLFCFVLELHKLSLQHLICLLLEIIKLSCKHFLNLL